MFAAAVFLTAEKFKQPTYSSTNERTDKMQSIHTTEQRAMVRRSAARSQATVWASLESPRKLKGTRQESHTLPDSTRMKMPRTGKSKDRT